MVDKISKDLNQFSTSVRCTEFSKNFAELRQNLITQIMKTDYIMRAILSSLLLFGVMAEKQKRKPDQFDPQVRRESESTAKRAGLHKN